MNIDVDGVQYEVAFEAEGGITLSEGEQWWGTRVKYRRPNLADRRWKKFLLLDVHPFDHDKIIAAVEQHVRGGTITTV